MFKYRLLQGNEDLDNIKEAGYYYFGSADTLIHKPDLGTSGSAGILLVFKTSSPTSPCQMIIDMEKGSKTAVRFGTGTWRFI